MQAPVALKYKGFKIMATENKLQEVVQSTLAQIRNMIDADTVIGSPITTESGTTIIPISKVAMGFATGGVDFNDKQGGAQGKPQNSFFICFFAFLARNIHVGHGRKSEKNKSM